MVSRRRGSGSVGTWAKACWTIIALSLFLACPLLRPAAIAGSQSIITLGLGVQAGIGRYSILGDQYEMTVVSELTARVRLARIFGAEFAFNPIATEGGRHGLGSAFRVTGVLYVVPTSPVAVYIVGGLGAREIEQLGTVSGSTNSYHAGAGIEVYLGDHFALSLEYLWLVPNASRIREAIEPDVEEIEEEYESGVPIAMTLPTDDLRGCFDGGNFQITLGLRYYL